MTVTYQDLVRWLALTQEGRTPIFASRGVSGERLNGDDLRELFESIMGEPTAEAMPGEWVTCPCCGHMSIDSLTPE